MIFNPNERMGLFIDGPNFYSSIREVGIMVDYTRLLEFFRSRSRFLRAYYYTALMENRPEERTDFLRKLTDWLSFNGYTVVTKPAKIFLDAAGGQIMKGNMDIEIAIDMLDMAPYMDHAVLCSGDGDFRRLVEAVQRRGVRVSIISTEKTLATELKRQADDFMDLHNIEQEIVQLERRPAQDTPSSTAGPDPAQTGPNAG